MAQFFVDSAQQQSRGQELSLMDFAPTLPEKPPTIEEAKAATNNIVKPGMGPVPAAAPPTQMRQVCFHWLKDKCRKGDQCEFLHERIEELIPLCRFHPNCQNDKCQFRHVDMIPECPFYARGFCKLGPYCNNKHIQKKICPNYAYGFCPKGPECTLTHPKPITRPEDEDISIFSNFTLPTTYAMPPSMTEPRRNQQDFHTEFNDLMSAPAPAADRPRPFKKAPPICFRCGEIGHKDQSCFNEAPDPQTLEERLNRPEVKKRLENVQCKKCMQLGHYANFCPQRKAHVGGPPPMYGA